MSISDPALVALFNPGGVVDFDGIVVSARTTLGLSAFYRACMLIAGTLASLPLNSWTGPEDDRKKVASVFDDPDGPDGQTPYEWKETLFLHLLLYGRAGAIKATNQAGGLVRLPLVHPVSFSVRQPTLEEQQGAPGTRMPVGGVWFDITLANNERVTYDADDFWYVPAASLGGQEGIGLIDIARQSIATSIAGDKAAGKLFADGALISGIATPDDEQDITDDVPEIRRQINNSMLGHENAGKIAVIARRLKFQPWTMTASDAQFLQSRQFQIEEISRWTGVPPHLLMQTDKQTSWGTGVDEQNRGLSKFVLGHWAQRVEQRASRLLARPRWVMFDFAGLERPNYAVQVDLVLKQKKDGLISDTYARKLLGIPETAAPAEPAPQDDPAPEPDPNGGNDDPSAE